MRSEFERGEISCINSLLERTARRVFSDVIGLGMLASETPKGPMSLPAFLPTRWTRFSEAVP